MTNSTNFTFDQISENNQVVDASIENLVKLACATDEQSPRADRRELEKTTTLLVTSSLILGERDEDEF